MIDKIIALSQIEISPTWNDKKRARVERRNAYYQTVLPEIHGGKMISWNWAAALGYSLWMVYRKAYIYACLLITFHVIVGYAMGFFLDFFRYHCVNVNPSMLSGIIFIINIFSNCALYILLGFFGNKIYYEYLKKKAMSECALTIYTSTQWSVAWCVLLVMNCSVFFLIYLGVTNTEMLNILTNGLAILIIMIFMAYDYVKSCNALRNPTDEMDKNDLASLETPKPSLPHSDDPQSS